MNIPALITMRCAAQEFCVFFTVDYEAFIAFQIGFFGEHIDLCPFIGFQQMKYGGIRQRIYFVNLHQFLGVEY